jgi:hypothetical protein
MLTRGKQESELFTDLSDVRIVQSSVDFIKHEERSRFERMNCEQKRESGQSLFSTAQVGHRLEAFSGCDTIVVDA